MSPRGADYIFILVSSKSCFEETALSWMPRADLGGEDPVVASRNVEPPEITIFLTARVVDPTTGNAFAFQDGPELVHPCAQSAGREELGV